MVGHVREDVIETLESVLGLEAVSLDPLGHEVEHLRFEMDRLAVGVTAATDESGVLEDTEMFGDGLLGHLLGDRQLAHRCVARSEPGDEIAADRISERREHPRQCIGSHLFSSLDTSFATTTKWLTIKVGQRD